MSAGRPPPEVTGSHGEPPYNLSDTCGPSRGSISSACHVSGPRGHRGNWELIEAMGGRIRPAHAGTGATAPPAPELGEQESGPRGHRGNPRHPAAAPGRRSGPRGDRGNLNPPRLRPPLPRPSHAGTGATDGSPPKAPAKKSGPRGHRGNDFEHRTTPRRRVPLTPWLMPTLSEIRSLHSRALKWSIAAGRISISPWSA